MPHRAVFTKAFLRERRKLSGETAKRVVEVVKEILTDPYIGAPLSEPLKGFWRARVSDYRIIYEVDAGGNRVVFHSVGHRRQIYER